jgi:hypothetical protein
MALELSGDITRRVSAMMIGIVAMSLWYEDSGRGVAPLFRGAVSPFQL